MKKIVVNKDWLDIDVLEDYLDGKLNERDMHMVEKYALEDPFVAEALAGLSVSPKRSLQSLSLLQKQLHDRIAVQATHKRKSVITWQRLSIAATAAVMFISVSIVFWMKNNADRQQAKKVEVVLAPKETAKGATGATPAGGYEAYKDYLEKNNKLKNNKIGQSVTLSFKINEYGDPEEIKVIDSRGKKYDDEAIRLLKVGPRWETPGEGPGQGTIEIYF